MMSRLVGLVVVAFIASSNITNATTIDTFLCDGLNHTISAAENPEVRVIVGQCSDGTLVPSTSLDVVTNGQVTRIASIGTTNINGGNVTEQVDVIRNGVLNVFSGQVTAINSASSSFASITGGTIGLFQITDDASGELLGGSVSNINVNVNGFLNIFGFGFNFAFGQISALTGQLTGILADGTAINAFFDRTLSNDPNFNGTINLIQVVGSSDLPEPSTLILILFALLGFGLLHRGGVRPWHH